MATEKKRPDSSRNNTANMGRQAVCCLSGAWFAGESTIYPGVRHERRRKEKKKKKDAQTRKRITVDGNTGPGPHILLDGP